MKCSECGGERFTETPSGYRFCKDCRNAKQRAYRHKIGKSANWMTTSAKDNTLGRFGRPETVTTVLERDGYSCVECKMSNKEHFKRYGKRLTIDHIDGRGRNTPKELRNNSLDNLQTMCLSCHGRKDKLRGLNKELIR